MSLLLPIQQELFTNENERILSICHVGKVLKKKKSFLCLVSSSSPLKISIVQVKQTDKAFKRKRSWFLDELKSINGISVDDKNSEFSLQLDKVYEWVAGDYSQKKAFIVAIARQCHKYRSVREKPAFKNIPTDWIEETMLTSDHMQLPPVSLQSPFDNDLADDFQAVTDKEQEDLTRLMNDCEFAIGNAEAFMDVLSRDLCLLDGENVQCVLASEQQMDALMAQMETAISEAEVIEQRLDGYDKVLCHVWDQMEKLRQKNVMNEVENKNNTLLLDELDNIITQLHITSAHEDTLQNADLITPEGLKAAIEAAAALRTAMNSRVNPALLQLAAVQEQRKRFDKHKDRFSQTVNRHLNNMFIHYGNYKGDPVGSSQDLTLPQRTTVHTALGQYTDLMHWSKVMDKKAYDHLRKIYTENIGKLYERDIKHLFEVAKSKIGVIGQVAPPTKNVVLLGIDKDQWTNQATNIDRDKYEGILEEILSLLEPVYMQEQQFCVSYFQLNILSPSSRNTQTTLDGGERDAKVNEKRTEKQLSEDVRLMMNSLFACLETELIAFIEHIERLDAFYCMYVLVPIHTHVTSAQHCHLAKTFVALLVHVKRSLDAFLSAQIESVREYRVPKKNKCGILPYVANLEEFARHGERLLRSERKADLEKWYVRLVDMILESVAVHSADHGKTPVDIIRMENYHHLYSLLSQLKISALDDERKEAKKNYTEALSKYVTLYFGRPLEKLNTFFDGVQAKVASGVKESEISYQLAFSKQELRKVINQYPGSTVKRGLEALYRKVEKHLSEESNLLQVVWRAMQEEFIRQYNILEELIRKCYPGSMITLEFTITDILNFFSDIARSH